MKRWRTNLALLAGVAAIGIAIPAFSQEAPAPLLPPGFGDPLPPPAPQDGGAPPVVPIPATPVPSAPPAPSLPSEGVIVTSDRPEDIEELEPVEVEPPIEIPDFARRDPRVVGPLESDAGGLGYDAFGSANGRFLAGLMRRLDAPLPSRWTSILLRRALLSRVPAPASVHPVDWVAERAWLLLRMGDADAARMLVQSVDVDQFTPKMFAVAVQSSLANADPAGLCPLVAPGRETSDEPVWPLADAMCAALAGESGRASALIDQARRRSRVPAIDVSLAEKIVGAGLNTRRAVTIQWDDVDRLNSWRFGLAAASGVEIPEELLRRAGPHVRAWHARAPMVPTEQRIDEAEVAAALGVFSHQSLIDIYSLIGDGIDPTEFASTDPGRLRAAYVARTADARVDAMEALWRGADSDRQLYGRSILTGAAAARIPPSEAIAGEAPELIASMLSAGYDRQASRWGDFVGTMSGADAQVAWALLAVGTPGPAVEVDAGRIRAFADLDDTVGSHRSRTLLAALAGLGRVPEGQVENLAESFELDLSPRTRWARMIDRAAERGQPGTVALLAAVAMQTGEWRGVPPRALYRILRSLRAVGLEREARLIAAEAIARA